MIAKRYALTWLAFCFTLLVTGPHPGYSSEETKGCHCFRNRTFNAKEKFSSDDYLLTTTFNSLLASEFNISKRQIIMLKMGEGVANNVLVTALYLAEETGMEVSQLLDLKKKYPWQEIINQLSVVKTSPDIENLFTYIATGVSDDQISEHITSHLIITRFSPSPESLELLKEKGLTPREIILANTLAVHTGTPALVIADQYGKNGLSWSEIAHNFGLEPADVGKLLEQKRDIKK